MFVEVFISAAWSAGAGRCRGSPHRARIYNGKGMKKTAQSHSRCAVSSQIAADTVQRIRSMSPTLGNIRGSSRGKGRPGLPHGATGEGKRLIFAAPLPLCLPFAPHRRKKHNLCLMIRLHSGKKQKIATRFPFSFRSFALSLHQIRLYSGKKQKIPARFPFSFRSFALSLPAQACCTPVPTEHFHIPKTRHMKKLLTLAMAATLCLGMGARPAAEADNADRPKTECPCKDCKCDECNGRCTDGCTECRPCHRRGHGCNDECRPCHRRGHDCDDECRPCHRHHAKHHRGHHRGCCR